MLRASVASTRRKYPFDIDAFVVLPDHLHAIWTLPLGDADFSTRWRLIKTAFAKSLPKQECLTAVRKARNERGIWQRRFWEPMIRDETDYARHVEYCYINPVKHGLVTRVRDWPHSSFHRDVERGIFPPTGRATLRPAASSAKPCSLVGGLAEGVTRHLRPDQMADYASLIRPTGYLL